MKEGITEAEYIKFEAEKRFKDEQIKKEVELEVTRLREKDGRTLWQRIFPWKIQIKRR